MREARQRRWAGPCFRLSLSLPGTAVRCTHLLRAPLGVFSRICCSALDALPMPWSPAPPSASTSGMSAAICAATT